MFVSGDKLRPIIPEASAVGSNHGIKLLHLGMTLSAPASLRRSVQRTHDISAYIQGETHDSSPESNPNPWQHEHTWCLIFRTMVPSVGVFFSGGKWRGKRETLRNKLKRGKTMSAAFFSAHDDFASRAPHEEEVDIWRNENIDKLYFTCTHISGLLMCLRRFYTQRFIYPQQCKVTCFSRTLLSVILRLRVGPWAFPVSYLRSRCTTTTFIHSYHSRLQMTHAHKRLAW